MVIISPPMSIDISGLVVSVALVCACTGTAIPNIPPSIAKAIMTAAVRVLFIKVGESTMDLKGLRESSLISFAAHYIARFLSADHDPSSVSIR
jgi:hypothetical protein